MARASSPPIASAAGTLRASTLALNAARVALLLGALFMLAFIRSGVPIYVYAGAVAVSLAGVWLTVRESADLKVWAFYLVGFVLFAQLRTLADETGIATQYAYAIDAEKALFFGGIPTIWLQDQFYSVGKIGVLEPLTIMTYGTYFVFPHVVVFAAWRFDRKNFPVYAGAIVGTVFAGLAVSFLVPTAPPWLAGQTGEISHVFRVIKDVGDEVTPATYQAAYDAVGPNDVAAMPSLHTAIPAAIAIVAWSRARRPIAVAAVGYLAAMAFSLVYLGEHYVVDVLAGVATAAVVTALVMVFFRGREGGSEQADADAENRPSDTAVHRGGERRGARH